MEGSILGPPTGKKIKKTQQIDNIWEELAVRFIIPCSPQEKENYQRIGFKIQLAHFVCTL